MTGLASTPAAARTPAEHARVDARQAGSATAFALYGLIVLLYPAIRPFRAKWTSRRRS